MKRYIDAPQDGQVNLTAALLLVAVIVTGVWIWKRLPLATQDYVTDQAMPLALLVGITMIGVWFVIRYIRTRRMARQERKRLVRAFTQASSVEKRLEIAFALIEANHYHREGLEEIAPALRDLFAATLTRSLGDKQHQIRGMSASHLGVVGDTQAVQLLLRALEDDHAYVRACAALGLGRLRASEAKERLKVVSVEDWDQTVRSRAREAMERIP
ncbi:MAG: HEAT repeat domain-containing protein [Nitrospiraceae bacterium]